MVSTPPAHEGAGALPGPDPATGPGPARRWTLSTTDGHSISGYLPGWAGDDPSEHNVPPGELAERLADIHHTAFFPGVRVPVYTAANRSGRPVDEEILSCTLDCTPFAESPEPRVPVVNLYLCEESWITDLDPEGVARVAEQLRARAELLLRHVHPLLVAARREWSTGTAGNLRPTC